MALQDAYLSHREHGIQPDADLALLEILTGPTPPSKTRFQRRDAELDPLILAAAASTGPHATRNHYQHDFFPAISFPKVEGGFDWTKWNGDEKQGRRLTYASRQAPRSQRLRKEKENLAVGVVSPVRIEPLRPTENFPSSPLRGHAPSTSIPVSVSASSQSPAGVSTSVSSADGEVEVKCMARTRIPTPHGTVFLHLYHNTRDAKEHLAIVVDPAQFSDAPAAVPIRSRTLDAVWNEGETDMDRIIRGAYTGRLSPQSRTVALPPAPSSVDVATAPSSSHDARIPPPLVRLHSECFTGETVGSMRCDCGEQLDEALRQMAQPLVLPDGTRMPGRGVVVYLRQEGRGIGLLSKLRAYNLQDLGHDTVAANLLLGHGADERRYDVAVAILRDLGLGEDGSGEGVRLLTNNPDKVRALEAEGLRVVERVPMVPRSWQKKQRAQARTHARPEPHIVDPEAEGKDDGIVERKAGATMVGGEAVYGEDLDKYLRTKVLRMGHMLSLQESP
ncbi:GTP cyclohydrolase II-domain-containing protein [Vararia minispora EC-137]|uniref:GTP cyclohydrolase II-domain-containing protein n=1 Tax=Vararia minispora EC-137 TaxID=1314806 RepID=A0ACB8QW79_9AGAM|nr:GTP cyclohydrolase II-domain-containing protein [Vararia minispora EC-137]